MSKIMHMDTQYAGISTAGSSLIDFFYPIGCYFETSDSAFNPNNVWIGTTWVLETEGQVHVSAGTNYSVGATGGASSRTIQSTILSDAQIAHGHGFTQPSVYDGSCTTYGASKDLVGWFSARKRGNPAAQSFWAGGICTYENSTTDGWSYGAEGSVQSTLDVIKFDANHTHTIPAHTHTVSGGAVSNLYGASSTRTAHGHGDINVMQPYVVVNRWHRTA